MPSKKTRELAAERGWLIAKAEYYDTYARRSKDLFGFIDFVALDDENIIGIQATSGSNAATRVNKILNETDVAAKRWLRSGGRILVIAWRKLKGSRAIQYREIEVVLTKSNELEAREY